jgi:hypothetical protein
MTYFVRHKKKIDLFNQNNFKVVKKYVKVG